MKKKMQLTGIAAGAVLLVTGAVYTVFIAPGLQQEKWIYMESAVERGTLTEGVTESGTLEYGITSLTYDLDLSVSDGEDDSDEEDEDKETIQKFLKVEEVYVAAGQRVQKGDALLKFTEDSLSSVKRSLQAALVNAKAEYNDAENEYDLAVLEAETDYEAKKVSEKYASSIYKNAATAVDNEMESMEVEITQRTNKIGTLEEKVKEAAEEYNGAKENFRNAQEAMSHTDAGDTVNFLVIQTAYLNARTKYENAENALREATENLEENALRIEALQTKLSDAGARYRIDKLDVKETYQESIINGENAGIAYEAKLEELKEDLRETEAEREKIEKQLEALADFAGEDGILYAEEEGIITEVGYEAGDRLTGTGTVVAYASLGDMTITVDVTQEDVVSLEVGSKVEIRFNAYPDAAYEGNILSIHTTAVSGESSTVSYEVVVAVEGDTKVLYGGMTADITFVTEQKEDVLYVPVKAVVEQEGKNYVYVKNGQSGKELREVQTGMRNSSSIEILSGLEEGDTIYIASRVSSEADVEASAEQGDSKSGMPDAGTTPDTGGNGSSGFVGTSGGSEMTGMSGSDRKEAQSMPGREAVR